MQQKHNCQRSYEVLYIQKNVVSFGNNMPDKNAVILLTDKAGPLALATLDTVTALSIESTHGTAMLNAYLMKHVRAALSLETPDVDDGPFLVGMARGGASITEIKAAIENADLDRNRQGQANIRVVLFETVRMFGSTESSATGPFIEMDVSLGGGKGIPFDEGEGWQWFIYNMGSQLVAGSFINLFASYAGAWLGN